MAASFGFILNQMTELQLGAIGDRFFGLVISLVGSLSSKQLAQSCRLPLALAELAFDSKREQSPFYELSHTHTHSRSGPNFGQPNGSANLRANGSRAPAKTNFVLNVCSRPRRTCPCCRGAPSGPVRPELADIRPIESASKFEPTMAASSNFGVRSSKFELKLDRMRAVWHSFQFARFDLNAPLH